MIVLTAALQEAENSAFIQMFTGIIWGRLIALLTETVWLSQWGQHAVPGLTLHVRIRNWLSLILSKLYFASDITDGVFHIEIIMAIYNSIVMVCLVTVLGSLFTIVKSSRIFG